MAPMGTDEAVASTRPGLVRDLARRRGGADDSSPDPAYDFHKRLRRAFESEFPPLGRVATDD